MQANIKEKTKRARAVFDSLERINRDRTNNYFVLGELLATLKKDRFYRYVYGDESQSWSSFCSEIHIPLSSADQKVTNWEYFVGKHKFNPIDLEVYSPSCLYYIALYKKDTPISEVKKWMEQAKILSRQDFVEEIKGIEVCAHQETEVREATYCKKCNKKLSNG